MGSLRYIHSRNLTVLEEGPGVTETITHRGGVTDDSAVLLEQVDNRVDEVVDLALVLGGGKAVLIIDTGKLSGSVSKHASV